ncbi:LacI family DNA-binding transcriptional regulator [Kytococcus sedentarius]|uniref:LacI family DNA-binding transcriptional regulator n=1 Tax=Kytococcus sedentarius TaxID=1276 RepID=UPI0035BC82C2
MSKPTRLQDLAARAGVSPATVSRVLNGHSVRPASSDAVVRALDALGLDRPTHLRPRRGGLVGLITPELSNPIFPALAQAIETRLAPSGYTAVLCTQTVGGVSEEDYVDLLLQRDVVALVVASGKHADTRNSTERYQRLLARGLPLVLVNGTREPVADHCLACDDALGVEMAVEHLVSLGHRRIGLAAGPRHFVPVRRKVEALRATGERLGVEVDVEHTFYTVEGGAAGGAALLDRGATAVVAASDLMALGVIREADARGVRVPGDLSVVGFDDSILMQFTHPPLTTVRQPVEALARATVDRLLWQLQGQDPPRHGEMLFAPELVVRGTTAASR